MLFGTLCLFEETTFKRYRDVFRLETMVWYGVVWERTQAFTSLTTSLKSRILFLFSNQFTNFSFSIPPTTRLTTRNLSQNVCNINLREETSCVSLPSVGESKWVLWFPTYHKSRLVRTHNKPFCWFWQWSAAHWHKENKMHIFAVVLGLIIGTQFTVFFTLLKS